MTKRRLIRVPSDILILVSLGYRFTGSLGPLVFRVTRGKQQFFSKRST